MTTKPLGQVLYEADYSAERNIAFPFSALHAPDQAEYERMAQAVAAVVREQCAQACEAQRMPVCTEWDVAAVNAIDDCVAAIRSMK